MKPSINSQWTSKVLMLCWSGHILECAFSQNYSACMCTQCKPAKGAQLSSTWLHLAEQSQHLLHMLCYEFGLDRSREEERWERRKSEQGKERGEREMGDRRGSEHPCPRVDHIAEFTITHTRASLAAHIVHISIIQSSHVIGIAVFFVLHNYNN